MAYTLLLRSGLGALLLILMASYVSPKDTDLLKIPHADSVKNPSYIQRHLVYSQQYPFLAYDDNHFEWRDSNAIKSIMNKLKHTPQKQVRIVQIGDSHIQCGVFTAEFRKKLQHTFGEGGRGLVFPYSVAGTNSADDYLSSHTGSWTSARNTNKSPLLPLGLSGVTMHTRQSGASFKMTFREGILKKQFKKIRVFCKADSKSFDLDVYYDSEKPPVRVRCSPKDNAGYPYMEITLPQVPGRVLEFRTVRTKPEQNFWEGYGIQILSEKEEGILYNSAGINGAGFTSLLRQELFCKQLSAYEPDLVILDIGVNDYYGGGFPQVHLERGLNKMIDSIKIAAPEACILITNPQDVYRGRSNVSGGELYAQLTKRVAIERGCIFYDYHRVSGGKYSMRKWSSNNLSSYDMLHLTHEGYRLKGELFFNGLLNTYLTWLIQPNLNEYLLKDAPSFDAESAVFASTNPKIVEKNSPLKKITNTSTTKLSKGGKIIYKIRNGDNLGFIAEKYNVSVSQLRAWNNLSSNKIVAGKSLVIYGSGHSKTTETVVSKNATTVKPKVTTKPLKGKIIHRVVSGDSLWEIAQKYGVSVAQIKSLNALRSDKLQIGAQLLIQK